MLLIVLDPARIRLALVIGAAADEAAAIRRVEQLDDAWPGSTGAAIAIHMPMPGERVSAVAGDRLVRSLPTRADLEGRQIVLVMGLDDSAAGAIMRAAHAVGALVNVEDRRDLCDFHMPALIRRGDLHIAISTGGHAPALAGHIRRRLEDLFPRAWAARLDELAERRRIWRTGGAGREQVRRRTDELIDRRGWLA
jgi:precorrin-2 dehydrogenase/sirohydrochlorin ferrochelatase